MFLARYRCSLVLETLAALSLCALIAVGVKAGDDECRASASETISFRITDNSTDSDFATFQPAPDSAPSVSPPIRPQIESPVPPPPDIANPSATRPANTVFRPTFARLSRLPNMYGKSLSTCSSFTAASAFSTVTLPVCVAGGQFDVSTNQSVVPQDRIFFNYHHFSNAYAVVKTEGHSGTTLSGNTTKDFDVNRYTFGIERTFLDERASVQVQLPIVDSFAASQINCPR
ncbi:MAG: hypothetical protein H6822_18415 [Planctomycetaceae bacterium]|nr:hypothetical protein [Planctomycetales bacterium]MCB9924161.1 hypothetical protein [Planctomycetaceae bacterium]